MIFTDLFLPFLSDSVRSKYDRSTKSMLTSPENADLDTACREYLKARADYKDFKIQVFKYVSRVTNDFKETREYKELYPEYFI